MVSNGCNSSVYSIFTNLFEKNTLAELSQIIISSSRRINNVHRLRQNAKNQPDSSPTDWYSSIKNDFVQTANYISLNKEWSDNTLSSIICLASNTNSVPCFSLDRGFVLTLWDSFQLFALPSGYLFWTLLLICITELFPFTTPSDDEMSTYTVSAFLPPKNSTKTRKCIITRVPACPFDIYRQLFRACEWYFSLLSNAQQRKNIWFKCKWSVHPH